MLDVRRDFPILNREKELIYFDNAATSLKPMSVVAAINDYYLRYSANAHRGDYSLSHEVDKKYEEAREKVRRFINAKAKEEIVFTLNSTQSLNMIVSGFFQEYLKPGDEVLISEAEHASNVLPWFKLKEEKGIVVRYIKLNEHLEVTLENVKEAITDKTKVISLAHISNVIGDIRPIKEISHLAHERGILVVVDGAQSVPHIKTDVQDLDCDFLVFSAHKMCGPTGVGILYGKKEYLENLKPQNYGGGMNVRFDSSGEYILKELPHNLEAGTPNIAGVIGFGAAIDYLSKFNMENIYAHELALKKYALEKMKALPNIEIYNETTESGIIDFNIKGVFSQDAATHFNSYGICVRAGHHCSKLLQTHLGQTGTCRISFYIYNTKEEIDKFIEVCKKGDEFLDAYFR